MNVNTCLVTIWPFTLQDLHLHLVRRLHHLISFPIKCITLPIYWLQVISEDVAVKDSEGKVIESQLLPLGDASMRSRNYHVKAYLGYVPTATPKFWLAFPVSVPPLGFSTYIISISRKAGQLIWGCFTFELNWRW